MKEVCDIIQLLKQTPSRLGKENILEKYKNHQLFKLCVKYAYHPKLKFNVKNVKFVKKVSEDFKRQYGNIETLFKMLDYLANKRGCTQQEWSILCSIASAIGTEAVVVADKIVKKNFDCGCSVKTFRKFFPDTLPVYELMKPISDIKKFMKAVKDPKNVVWSIKLDGIRNYCVVDSNNNVQHWSTRGKALHNFHHFDENLIKLANQIRRKLGKERIPIIFDGEVTYHSNNNEIEDFQKGLTQVSRKSDLEPEKQRYQIFGIPLDNKINFVDQYNILIQIDFSQFNNITLVTHYLYDGEWSEEGIKKHAQYFIDQGREGIVYKYINYVFERKRSNLWLRVKKQETVDLPVIGFEYGTGKNKNVVGALICVYNGIEVKVGSGLSDEDRKEFLQNLPKVIEVEYTNITKDGSLRNPVFKRVRDDKIA
jgi:DNA ligase-1